ncbi:MAG: hypothetical protein K2Q18_03565, partial [Bdellovibrionales bacterium]|nr:hypothetical protein [Bdellovibrionales bacterium]
AEFSAGLPFETLSELPNFKDPKEAANFLAKGFIDSYSYLKEGSQKESVSSSSATVSVIEASEIETFVTSFKSVTKILEKIAPLDKSALAKRMMKKFSMDNPELMDLGRFIIELRLLNKDSKIDLELTKLIRLLNIESVQKLRSNPRIRIVAPVENAQMVFGFNNWENGSKSEYLDNTLFQEIINTKNFVNGPKKNEWPVKKFENKSTMVSPFAPGINSFEYYFLSTDGKTPLSKPQKIKRSLDVVEISQTKKTPGAFLVYSAYTQQIGTKAEKYTGISISTFNTAPSMDYIEMEFNQLVNWLKL